MLTQHIRESLQVTPGPFPDFWVGPGDEAKGQGGGPGRGRGGGLGRGAGPGPGWGARAGSGNAHSFFFFFSSGFIKCEHLCWFGSFLWCNRNMDHCEPSLSHQQ